MASSPWHPPPQKTPLFTRLSSKKESYHRHISSSGPVLQTRHAIGFRHSRSARRLVMGFTLTIVFATFFWTSSHPRDQYIKLRNGITASSIRTTCGSTHNKMMPALDQSKLSRRSINLHPGLKIRKHHTRDVHRFAVDDNDSISDDDEGLTDPPDENLPDLLKQLMKKAADGKLPGDTQITFMDADKFAHLQDLKRKRQKKEEAVEKEKEGKTSETMERIKTFDYRPKEIRDYLDRFVIKQSDAKKVLSIAICDHYNHVRRMLEDPANARRDYCKPNVLLLGPTGVGKTYLMRNIAEFIGVPFVKADATKFSETGIVGRDAEDLVRDLVEKANGDKELAEIGIIYIDEVDKIANPGTSDVRTTSGSGFNTRGVQNNLLKLMEDTEVSLQNPMAPQSLKSLLEQGGRDDKAVRTKNILFIFSGAFNNLNEKLKEQHGESSNAMFPMFENTPMAEERTGGKKKSFLDKATTRDFIEAGIEPEFIGRVPVRCALEALTAEDLLYIMTNSEGSVLRQLEEDFKGYGITMNTTTKALEEIAARSEKENTGARGIVTVLENTLREFKFELPSLPITSFTIDNATVCNPREMLEDIIASVNQTEVRVNDLESFASAFGRDHDPVQIEFDFESTKYLADLCVEKDWQMRSYCRHIFKGLPDVLKRIYLETGQDYFLITKEMAENPNEEMAKWLHLLDRSFETERVDLTFTA